jgi:galactokinase
MPKVKATVRVTGCIQQVDATLPKLNRFMQGGVYGTRETGGGFGGAANRHLAALEGGRVIA